MSNPHRTTNLVYRRWRPQDDREEAARQAKAIHEQYSKDPDTSIRQLTAYLDGMLSVVGSDELIWCFDGEHPVGVISYIEKIDTAPPFCFIFNFAVLPSHQRRGIGTALLEQVKDVVRGRLPIIVRGINDVAIPRLVAGGFWEIPGYPDNRRFKWTDMPEHQNNETPWDCDNN